MKGCWIMEARVGPVPAVTVVVAARTVAGATATAAASELSLINVMIKRG